jgi:hypothetical protein
MQETRARSNATTNLIVGLGNPGREYRDKNRSPIPQPLHAADRMPDELDQKECTFEH